MSEFIAKQTVQDDLMRRAEIFATRKHVGQLRKNRATPFISHPAGVVESLRKAGVTDPSVLAAAWLHDTVEDTDTTMEEIYSEFGTKVGDLVSALTKQEPREEYHRKILGSSKDVKLLEVADLEHNLRTVRDLDKAGRARKLREACELYLPLKKDLCKTFDCEELFNALEEHVRKYEQEHLEAGNQEALT